MSATTRAMRLAVARLRDRIMLTVGRAVLKAVNDAPRMQEVQAALLAGELRGGLERFQEYGFTSVPLPGAEAVVLFIGGNRDHGAVVASDDRRYRLKGLQPGEVALYDDQGQTVILKRDRIEVTAPKVVVNSADVHLGAEGGPKVARIGDRVNVASGSSAGLWPIVEGSSRVAAAD